MISWDLLTLPFVRLAMAASLMIGLSCSYLGLFVVLRRAVFVGIALAQLAALGAALSHYVNMSPAVTALGTTLLGSIWLGWTPSQRLWPGETRIGAAYVAASATAILLIAKSAQGETHVLDLLFGNILTVTGRDLWLLGTVAVVVLGVQLLFGKELLFVSFDAETANTSGYNVRGWNLLFNVSLAVAISTAIHVGGAILVFSFMVQPAMIGLRLAHRLPGAILWTLTSATVATVLGVVLSVGADLPTGPSIVVVSSALVLLAGLVRR